MRLPARIGSLLAFGLFSAAAARAASVSRPAKASATPIPVPAPTTDVLPGNLGTTPNLSAVLRSLHAGQSEAAAADLQKIRAGGGFADPGEAHYLIGTAWLAAGKPQFAVLPLRQASRSYSALPDYALFNLGEAYLQLDRSAQAVEAYERLIVDYPESVLLTRARLRLADALVADEQWERAKDLYQQVLDAGDSGTPDADLQMRIAACLENAGRQADAGDLYFKVWREQPVSDYANTAAQKLDELAAAGVHVPSRLAPDVRWRRALAMAEQGDAKDSLAEIDRLAAARAHLPSDWRLRRALILFRMRDYTHAETELDQKVIPSLSSGSLQAEAIYWLARTQSRLNDYPNALKTYDKLRSKYPKEKWSRDGLYKEGLICLDDKAFAKAVGFFDLYAKTYPTASDADEAIWYSGWTLYRGKKLAPAEQTLRRLMEAHPRSSLVPRAQYWVGRLQLLEGHKEQGIATLAALARDQSLTYYGMLAAGVLNEAGVDVPLPTTAVADESEDTTIDESPDAATAPGANMKAGEVGEASIAGGSNAIYGYHLMRATTLIRLGFQVDAAQELSAARSAAVSRTQKLELARMALAADYFHGAQYIASVAFSGDLETGDPSSEAFHLAYPKAFGRFVTSYASQYKYSPCMLWAIMREESAFAPDALSPVGAIGLLQIMPYTGQEIANALGVKGFNADRLYDPEINIGFSAWYVRKLIEKYGGNEALAIASYNAGPDAVDRWLTQRGDLNLDEFVEEIPYTETRHYVKRVLMSYGIYETLYGSGVPRIHANHTVAKEPLVHVASALGSNIAPFAAGTALPGTAAAGAPSMGVPDASATDGVTPAPSAVPTSAPSATPIAGAATTVAPATSSIASPAATAPPTTMGTPIP